jgi:uncharacterized protein YjaG (DUF416 family)
MTPFDEFWLKPKVGHLSKEKQLAFALLLCERMVPALNRFANETGFDNSIYRERLEDAWCYLKQGTSPSTSAEVAEQCLDHAPDTEEFNHPLTSAALNAALSLAATMSFLADGDINHVVEAAGLARDTAALHAQGTGANPPRSLNFEEVMRHPLVQHELRQQVEALEFLTALPTDVSQQTAAPIKERAARTPPLFPPGVG